MSMNSVGDKSQVFLSLRNNMALKTRLGTLVQELSTGQSSDLVKRLGADQTRLSDVDRQLTLLSGYGRVTTQTAQSLSLMQTTIARTEETRSQLAAQMLTITAEGAVNQNEAAARAARDAMDTVVSTLNLRFSDQSLFAGAAVDGPALASAETIMAELATVTAGATTSADVIAAIDTWFDTPAGGFETVGYLGDTGPAQTRRIDQGTVVALDAKADDPAFRDMFKAVALAAVVAEGALPGDAAAQTELLQESGLRLMASATSLTQLQARLGGIEGRVQDTATRHAARETTLGLIRNDMTSADPFETAAQLEEVQLQLETHYTVTARLSRLSLAEYLR
ncbi:MAG: flagellar biosynthesis protein FlgL [Thalassobium sp.]|uniref:flagellin n=1 Tax=Octadecabacter sp. SW4 TaxID=2602067 RepID=UPI000C10A97C|nr:flagellin [Octadecabacter sp. SW4]PHQ85405.1 MAG: flagellar biosynthesis protein FlgL [Thalassobium sp.]QEE37143.1 flagellar biosynthesis protein FlgL [Octadecabacter sp. SW4]